MFIPRLSDAQATEVTGPVYELATLFVEPDRSAVISEMVAPARQEAWLFETREQLTRIAEQHDGERDL